jgi:hypothetical protein
MDNMYYLRLIAVFGNVVMFSGLMLLLIGFILHTSLFFSVFPICVILFFVSFGLTYLFPQTDRVKLILELWESMKKIKMTKVILNYSLLPGEKVLFKLTPCYIETFSPMSFSFYPRDIIITNLRVLVGFTSSFLIMQTETFQDFNLWKPSLKKAPKYKGFLGPVGSVLGGNMVLSKVSLGKHPKLGDYVNLQAKYVGNVEVHIFHPESKKVVTEFLKK